MKISFNPSNSNKNILDLIKNNKDIIFDLKGHSIFARGVEFKGTDTNTWRDIKINNVSIGSHTLDLRNGSNTTLTNTNGVVTINSTWRPVVDNLTSDSTTSSLSAKQGKVLKALIDGKSDSDHNHDGRYLKLTGGTMASNALITFADSGSWGTSKKPQGARGGLYWTGQSDYAKLYAEETVGDNLDLVIQFGDDNSNGLSIRNKANTQTSYISSSGVITTGTFKGNLDWSYITNKPATATRWPSWAEVTGKPSSFTPSTHTHGLSNSVFFLNMPSINGNAKWKEVFGYPVNYNLLLSVRINNPAPEWCVGNFGSGILYGGSDTKGFMSSAYNEPFIMWAGGNGSSDDSVPKWYIGIKGTHKSIYNLATIASEANAAYNLRHSHANKSVLDGITSALVNSWNTAYNFVSNITGTDTDKVINKWEEIVNFLAGITEDNKLNTLLNSKLSVYELANNTNVGTIKNNGIYYSTTDASSGTLINSPFNTGFALINMTSYDGGDDLRRSRLAFNAYGEIKVSDDRDQANTAETWYNVLTSKNSGINGSTIKLNGTSITVYSSGTADGRYVKKSGDTMSGVLTIDTTNFGALTIKRNDDANGASIQFRGKSSVYGYIGLNNSTKDKQFLRWSSDTSRIYTILDTSSTYISNGKGVINGTTITQVDNATNSTNSTNARKLVNWYSARPTSLNAQFGDGSLRIFYATSSTTEGKPAEDSHILHLAWDNTGGYDAQLAVHARSGKVSTRAQNAGTWQPWKTLAFTTDIPSSLKNPYSFNVFGVVYDGSAAKTVTTSNFISQVNEGTSTITDGTMLITSYASNSGFADTNAVNVPYKRKAIHLWEYIKAKTDRTASAYWKAGWYKVASAQTAANTEAFLTLDVNAAKSNGHATLFIRKRADSKPYFICTHNNNLNLADFRLYYNGMSMVLYARVPNDWNGRVFRIISEGREGTYDHIWTLYSNVSSTDPNAISAEGGNPYINPTYSGRVDWSNSSDKANYANSAGSVAWNNVTGKPSAFNPAAHTHTVFKNNLMIKGTNGISDSASIHLGIGDSDTGFKWISDGVCQIYANNAAVGQWTSGGMDWFKNPTVNGNKVWNAGNDGSGSGLDADTLDGYHASSFVRAGHYESNDLNKLDTYSFIRSVNSNVSSTSPKGNTGWYNVIQLVHRNGASDGPSYIGQIALGMTTNTNDMFFRGKRTDPWKTVIHSGNYTEFINNYYWANVKISTSSSTTTSPTVSNLTATNSIRLGDIHLEYTNEINSYGGLFINYRSSADVDLCQGGGNVCIGATLPTQKLDVRGNIITKGLGIQPYYLSKSVLPTIRLDDGYTYKCLEISATTEISCIIANRAGLMSERGILIKFNKGYDGQIILLKDLQSYGSGNGYFWVMPSGCKIISADNSSILVGQNQISNTYDDGRSRFLVYSSVYSVWIEFLCSNTF